LAVTNLALATGQRPSTLLGIEDPTLALLWDLALVPEVTPPVSVKEKILRKRRRLGIPSYRV